MGTPSLRALVAAAPDIVENWVLLAQSLEASGELVEAASAWRMAHRLLPNSPLISDAVTRLETVPATDVVFQKPSEASEPDQSGEAAGAPNAEPLNIDALISDLESGKPANETENHEEVAYVSSSASESDEIATETLAKIYEGQNLFEDAARIYRLLADREKDSAKSEILHARAEDLRRKT